MDERSRTPWQTLRGVHGTSLTNSLTNLSITTRKDKHRANSTQPEQVFVVSKSSAGSAAILSGPEYDTVAVACGGGLCGMLLVWTSLVRSSWTQTGSSTWPTYHRISPRPSLETVKDFLPSMLLPWSCWQEELREVFGVYGRIEEAGSTSDGSCKQCNWPCKVIVLGSKAADRPLAPPTCYDISRQSANLLLGAPAGRTAPGSSSL